MPTVTADRPEPGITVLTLNRPDRLNAFTYEMVDELLAALDDIDADHDCRVVVLTGAGRGFSAGLDVKARAEAGPPAVPEGLGAVQTHMLGHHHYWAKLPLRLLGLRVPVVAAVNGPAVGAGFGLALACDIRLAAQSATFHNGVSQLGLSGCEFGFSWFLPRLVGMSHAADLLLTGRPLPSAEAREIGLVSGVAPDAEVLPAAMDRARLLAAQPAFSLWMTKQTMWANLEAPNLQTAMALELRAQVLGIAGGDIRIHFAGDEGA